jgi:hypothetical protein
MYRSIIGRRSSSAYVSVIGLRTRPWMRSFQPSGEICGTISAVSIR